MNKILAIDDTRDNLVSIKALLKMLIPSCQVITASSGKQGIQLALTEQPDVILLDIHMPEMDGFEVCTVLKSKPGTADIPIVILTAMKTASHHRVKALELGADAFLTKPINESELAAQVKAMLRIKAAEDRLRDENLRLEELVEERANDLFKAKEQLIIEKSERKIIQKTLSESENRFKIMIEKSPLPMVITDANQDLLFLNEKFTRLFGYTLNDIPTAQAWWHMAYPDPEYRKKVRSSWEAAIEEAEGSSMDIGMQVWEITTKDQNIRTCEFNMVPLGDMSLIVMNDITDRIAVEKQRVQLEKQLQQAQKMEAVGALAGGIAHDFNNILYPLIGFAQLLKEDIPKTSPLNESVDEILQASFRAKDLVQQILSFSRQMDQEAAPIKVQSIIKEAVRLSKSIIPATISIQYNVENDCVPVMADPTQIHQLVMNLITNAYHAMEKVGGELNISLNEKTLRNPKSYGLDLPPGSYVCLSVKDSGVGMSEKILSRIFDPYFTTKGIAKGTGLGLSVVHGIVKNYKGDIYVTSTPGKGSEFKIYFPPAHATLVKDETFKEKSDDLKGSGRILLVDDEPHVIKIEKTRLEKLGYRVISMENPIEAFELFSARPGDFDLVISDMTMPGMTGISLAKKIHGIKPDFPVIICTGFSDQINKDSAGQLGISALLMKPVLVSDLAHAVKDALSRSDQGRGSALLKV